MRAKGQTNVLSINIGTYETAPERREAYIRAAKAAKKPSLGSWCRAVLDKAAKHKAKERDRWGAIVGGLLIGAVVSAHGYDYEQHRQANAMERLAQAQETRNALSGSGDAGTGCGGLWPGGAVPEGCQLRMDVRKINDPEKRYVNTIAGPDGKKHAVYLLYCPND